VAQRGRPFHQLTTSPLFRERLLTISKIPILYDRAHTVFHDKCMVIYSHLVLTGSFNLTLTAEYQNAGNPILVDSLQIAALYAANWLTYRAHSGAAQSVSIGRFCFLVRRALSALLRFARGRRVHKEEAQPGHGRNSLDRQQSYQ
jgi:phosphatidylserine/phosphatidylglycerophosphate/cardiolipin synthase-like enzyme